VCYLILLWTRDQTHLAPHFRLPPFDKKTRRTGHSTVVINETGLLFAALFIVGYRCI
jgi:hypothetical protein